MRITKFCSYLAAVLMIISLFSGCTSQSPSLSPSPSPSPSPSASPAGTENPPAEPADTYEEGTSATDDIVNTTAADKVILVVS